MNHRYESADNRNKHAAIVNEQMKKRGKDGSEQDDNFLNSQENFELLMQK